MYRLLDKVQALSPVANTEATALRSRLLAVRGAIPQVLIDYADPALRTQAQALQTRLQAQGLGVRLRSTPAAPGDFSAGWQPTGLSDRALGRWVAAQAGRVMQSEALAAQAAPTAASGDATDTYRLVLARSVVAPVSPEAASSAAAGTAPTTAPASTPRGTGATPALSPGTRFRDCQDDTVCPWLVVLPAGNFMMGSPELEKGRFEDEGPQHPVTLARPFALMEAEVTRGQFAAFVRETGRAPAPGCFVMSSDGDRVEQSAKADWRNPGFVQDDSHPVVCVSWADSKAYAAWLSAKTGQSYRLPSEAEWEYAARAGSARRYSFGDDEAELCRHANVADRQYVSRYPKRSSGAAPCDDGHVFTAPVKRYAANTFGLYDLHGNVWEWVEDCWHERYQGAPTDGSVRGTDCSTAGRHASRGGGWTNNPNIARSAIRNGEPLADGDNYLGFRLARTLGP